MARERLREMLIRHEGLRLKLYRDSLGIETIAVGRNLRDVGVSELEAMYLLDNDIKASEKFAEDHLMPWFNSLSVVRQDVVLDMVFCLRGRFLEFKKTIQALIDQDYDGAANEIMHSYFSSQVGSRAVALSEMMRTGRYI